MSIESCMCGATDCPSCYPERFVRGRCRYVECEKCGEEFEPGRGDTSEICEDCRRTDGSNDEGEDVPMFVTVASDRGDVSGWVMGREE
jgi:hypothetical protein